MHYLSIVAIINTIIHLGNVIAGGSSGSDTIKKSLDALKMALFPEEEDKLEKRTDEIKKKMEKELARGPLKVRAVGGGKKKKNRRPRG